MANSTTARLKAAQTDWENAEARGGFKDLPTGQSYNVKIVDAVVKPTKAGNRDQVVWTLKVLDGEYKGQQAWKYSGLSSSMNLEFLKGDLNAVGVEPPDKLIDLGKTLENECVGVDIRMFVRQGKDKDGTPNEYVNYDFKERLVVDEGNETTEEVEKSKYTADEITAMGAADDEAALQAIIDAEDLDVNQDDYETYAEVADLIIDALGL